MQSFRDQTGYDAHYSQVTEPQFQDTGDFVQMYEEHFMRSFPDGGWVFDGRPLQKALASMRRNHPPGATVLDCGSGVGHSTLYLEHLGFDVTGVEISEQGVALATQLRDQIGMRSDFVAASLEHTGLPDNSVDAFFGRNTLHHFIKYPGVAEELRRVPRPGAQGYFVDPFGENALKNLSHTRRQRERMAALGDVLLTNRNVRAFFSEESVDIEPVCWFAILDKAYVRLFGWKRQSAIRKLARLHDSIDRAIPHNRMTLWLSCSVVTRVRFA